MKRFFNTKYNAKSTYCRQGHKHHSKFEAAYCDQLGLLKRANEITEYSTQKRFDFYVNDIKICSHYVDFYVTHNDGREEVHEAKGFSLGVWEIKHRLFKALYPNIPYIVVRKGAYDKNRKKSYFAKKAVRG